MSRIDSLRLINMQSWDKDSPLIKLSLDKLNVFIARSETGKSVPFKANLVMCFYNFWGRRTRKGLIRRNSGDLGRYALQLENGSIIIFELTQKSQSYYLLKADGSKRMWTQDYPPNEILNELGWHMDLESKMILNIIHKDMPTPFVDTTPKWNARILKFVTAQPELEAAMNVMTEAIARIEQKELEVRAEVNSLMKESMSLRYVDEHSLRVGLRRKEEALRCFEGIDSMGFDIRALYELKNRKPSMVRCGDIEPVVDISGALHGMMFEMSNLQYINGHKPEVMSEIPVQHAEKVIDLSAQICDFNSTLREYNALCLNKPVEEQLNKDFDKLFGTSQIVHDLKMLLFGLQKTKGDRRLCEVSLNTAKKDLKRLEEQLGVCPTCGKAFGG